MISGIEGAYHSNYKTRVEHEIGTHNQSINKSRLPSYTINSLMAAHGLERADYLSLDTQTSELDVLRAYDAKKHPIRIIGLDFNGCNQAELLTWFRLNGYKQVWKHACADDYLFERSTV